MRKSNSVFKTAFVSEAGAELANNDYFAYVEHDDFACYVLASGITDFETSEAAKEVVEHLILSFEEKPSMSKMTLRQYMKETNERLLSGIHAHRLKASVIMLVTNYEKFRYVSAGNVRLRMYRNGRFLMSSADMSLADDLIKKGESETPLDRHEERHNLYAYLGKKDDFHPYISDIQKLNDADIISLYSKGLWEHVDAQEIDEIFSEASDNPQESVDLLEDVLLSRQPPNLKSYTIVAIFINKIYRDPERERKRLRYIKIAAIILVILLLIAIIWYIFYRIRQGKLEDMQNYQTQSQKYMSTVNFKPALENAQNAEKLARDLKLKDESESISENVLLLQTLIQADEFFSSGNYNAAYENYLQALKNSGSTDVVIRDYIQRQISFIETDLSAQQFMKLGDLLFQNGEYDEAEAMYNKAGEQSSIIHDMNEREKATAALEKVYDKRAELRKDAEQKLAQKKQVALSDALKKGDDLLAAGDIEGAQNAYLDARNLSDDPADRTQISAALGQVSQAREKKAAEEKFSDDERKKQFQAATDIETQGDETFAAGDYVSAQMYYMTAIERFDELVEPQKVQVIQSKFDLAKTKSLESRGTKIEAEDTEQRARNLYAEKNYPEAKAAATKAKELYTTLAMKSKIADMDILLEQIATDAQISDSLK